MPVLTQQQKDFYENTLRVTRQEIEDLKDQIEEELSKVKQRIADLQEALNAAKQMYEAACNRLGVPNDLEEGDSDGQ
jgi:predicted  nucleic acid-binding Zn-ribbon protein